MTSRAKHVSGCDKNANPSKINKKRLYSNAFHGQYKLAAGDQQVASTAWFGLLGARANDGILVWKPIFRPTRNPSLPVRVTWYYTATCFRLIGVFSRPTPVRVDERTTGRIWKTQRMKRGFAFTFAANSL
jgi:hypothetical protein